MQYVKATTCSLMRRPKLKDGWYFECQCHVCSSSDDAGSFISALRCQKCSPPLSEDLRADEEEDR